MKIYVGGVHPSIYEVTEVKCIGAKKLSVCTGGKELYIDLPANSDLVRAPDVIEALYYKGVVRLDRAEVYTSFTQKGEE